LPLSLPNQMSGWTIRACAGAKLSKSAVSAAVGFMGVPFGWLGFCGFGFAASLRRLPWDGFKAAFARA
jgi:hypothetical protein